ncbi:hypothetical protein TWF281_011307 [Arthrobotrys megalospora]
MARPNSFGGDGVYASYHLVRINIVFFLTQLLFAVATQTRSSSSSQLYSLPVRSPSPIEKTDGRHTRASTIAYIICAIALLCFITSLYRGNSGQTSIPATGFRKTDHPNFFHLETLDHRRPDHSDKIKYWESYSGNFLDCFKLSEEKAGEHFQINVLLIDSGIDTNHLTLQTRKEEGMIKPWHDYTVDKAGIAGVSLNASESSLEDKFGHGTCGAYIIGKFAESAVVYSARVFKDTGEGGVSRIDPADVAKAIYDAIDNKDGVKFDFIVMPLGFPEGNGGLHELEGAIRAAYNEGIVLVAAAGNDGNCRNPAPPACYPQVICALSCDGNGTPSGFSPSIHVNASNKEFLVPGEGIECAWIQPGKCHRQERNPPGSTRPPQPDEKSGFTYVSGTSFACSVLAAICIVILERSYEIAKRKYKTADAARKNVDSIRRYQLREILNLMARPQRGAYLLVPTQVTDEMLEKYI